MAVMAIILKRLLGYFIEHPERVVSLIEAALDQLDETLHKEKEKKHS